jgi:hypothetical protein
MTFFGMQATTALVRTVGAFLTEDLSTRKFGLIKALFKS